MKTKLKLSFMVVLVSLLVLGCNNQAEQQEETPVVEATSSEVVTEHVENEEEEAKVVNAEAEFEALKAQYFSVDTNVENLPRFPLSMQYFEIILTKLDNLITNEEMGEPSWYVSGEYYNELDYEYFEDFFEATQIDDWDLQHHLSFNNNVLGYRVVEREDSIPIHEWYYIEVIAKNQEEIIYTEERIYEIVRVIEEDGNTTIYRPVIKEYYRKP